MSFNIQFPEAMRAPLELPLYAAVAPAWDVAKVAKLAAQFDVQGEVADAGPWYVCRNRDWTIEVYQATHSLRLDRHDFDAEGRGDDSGKSVGNGGDLPDRQRAMAVAERFLSNVGTTLAQARVDSVTELQVMKATRENCGGERQLVALQVNYRYALGELPLFGPGAKAQVTVGRDGRLAQAYRFARELRQVGQRASVSPAQAFERFAASPTLAELPRHARLTVASAQLGLLSLPPTEVQGVLMPCYQLQCRLSTELLPKHEFTAYVAAIELDAAVAKRQRWSRARPALLAA